MSTNVFVDVDLTLVDADGQMLEGARESLEKLRVGGCTLFLWSAAGTDYARSVAERHDLIALFEGFSAKPDVAIDDMPETTRPSKVFNIGNEPSWHALASEILEKHVD
jgi:hypothetical protein